MKPKIRAERILKELSNYTSLIDPPAAVPSWVSRIALRQGEKYVGLYENEKGGPIDSIVITNRGLYILTNGGCILLDFENIKRIKAPDEKRNYSVIVVETYGGEIVEIPVRGGSGKFRDSFEFLRFLMRSVEDVQGKANRIPGTLY